MNKTFRTILTMILAWSPHFFSGTSNAESSCHELFDCPKNQLQNFALVGLRRLKKIKDSIRYYSAVLPKGVRVLHRDIDDFDNSFWAESVAKHAEVGVFEAVDRNEKIIFRTKVFTSNDLAHIYQDEYLEVFIQYFT